MTRIILMNVLFVLSFCVFSMAPVEAQVVDLFPTPVTNATVTTFTGGTTDFYADDTIGFRFTVGADDILVSSLGFYDEGADGLVDPHDVGIFTTSGSLLASLTVPNGVVATLDSGFRMVDLPTAFSLDSGASYVILGYRPTASDAIRYDVSLTTSSLITYDTEIAQNATGGLIFTNTPFGWDTIGWFGPTFSATPIPEPSSVVLLGIASVLLLTRRQRGNKGQLQV
jgi:hypothetical protein